MPPFLLAFSAIVQLLVTDVYFENMHVSLCVSNLKVLKEITFKEKGCIQLNKSDSIDIYVTKNVFF